MRVKKNKKSPFFLTNLKAGGFPPRLFPKQVNFFSKSLLLLKFGGKYEILKLFFFFPTQFFLPFVFKKGGSPQIKFTKKIQPKTKPPKK